MIWIAVTVSGLILCLSGFKALVGQYRTGAISVRWLLVCMVGWLSFVSYAVADAIRPELMTGPVTIVWLLPAFIAIAVLANEYQANRSRHTPQP